MKSRRLLCILIVFIVLAGMGIIGGTVFVVNKVEVNFLGTTGDKTAAAEAIRKNVALEGKSILFSIDEQSIRTKIKSADPLVKVENIKAEFPNKVVIDVRERKAVYIWTDGHTAMTFDADMCIMYKAPGTGSNLSGLVDISETGIDFDTSAEIGDTATGADSAAGTKIEQLKIVSTYLSHDITSLITKISFDKVLSSVFQMRIDVGAGTELVIMTKGGGVDILLPWVWTALENTLTAKNGYIKHAHMSGEYTALFNISGEIIVHFNESGTDDNLEATFSEKEVQ